MVYAICLNFPGRNYENYNNYQSLSHINYNIYCIWLLKTLKNFNFFFFLQSDKAVILRGENTYFWSK